MSESALSTATRYVVSSTEGAPVSVDRDRASERRFHLAEATLVVCAETATEGGRTRVRIASPAGWVDADWLAEADPPRSLRYGNDEFARHHRDVDAGVHYGLEFPFTIEMVGEWGPEFLTKAFRAAGTIDEDDRVTAIESVERCEGGQASEKAFVHVTYAKGGSRLGSRLFVKVPASDPERKRFLADTVPFEVEFARRSAEHPLPFSVPRYYFGDYSARTSNYILITETVPYGEAGIAPPCEKGYDHLLPDARERYLVLTRALAGLAAAHKDGRFGLDVEAVFPFPRNAPRARPAPDLDVKLENLVHFVGETAPNLFPDWATKPEFLETFRADVLFGLEHADELAAWLHSDVDYVGLCHPNLNLDNAWFWHDAEGELQAGLLDWGMTRQMAYAQAITGMLMFPEPEGYRDLVRDVLRVFIAELAREGGPRLDEAKMRQQLQVSLFMSTIQMVLGILVDQLTAVPEAEYRTMADRFDARLLETGLCAGIIWVRNVLEEWAHETTPGDACRAALGRRPASDD